MKPNKFRFQFVYIVPFKPTNSLQLDTHRLKTFSNSKGSFWEEPWQVRQCLLGLNHGFNLSSNPETTITFNLNLDFSILTVLKLILNFSSLQYLKLHQVLQSDLSANKGLSPDVRSVACEKSPEFYLQRVVLRGSHSGLIFARFVTCNLRFALG